MKEEELQYIAEKVAAAIEGLEVIQERRFVIVRDNCRKRKEVKYIIYII